MEPTHIVGAAQVVSNLNRWNLVSAESPMVVKVTGEAGLLIKIGRYIRKIRGPIILCGHPAKGQFQDRACTEGMGPVNRDVVVGIVGVVHQPGKAGGAGDRLPRCRPASENAIVGSNLLVQTNRTLVLMSDIRSGIAAVELRIAR